MCVGGGGSFLVMEKLPQDPSVLFSAELRDVNVHLHRKEAAKYIQQNVIKHILPSILLNN